MRGTGDVPRCDKALITPQHDTPPPNLLIKNRTKQNKLDNNPTPDPNPYSYKNEKDKMKKATIYILDPIHPQALAHAHTLFNVIPPDDPECQNWRANATAILIRGRYITAADIAASPNLRVICKHGVGLDKIDQIACNERGIKVLNTPGSNTREVAELVLGLTLAVARKFRPIITRQQTETVSKESCLGLSLYGKTIGIVGMGNIGRTVAEMFHSAFGAEILACDLRKPASTWSHLPHRRAESIDDLLEESDMVTLHVPLTDETRGMIAYDQLRRMKPTAIIINAARGGIVNEDDLARALSEGHLWGAGLDCHELEPPTREQYGELWKSLNVISTPHIEASTASALVSSGTAAINNLYEYLSRRENGPPWYQKG